MHHSFSFGPINPLDVHPFLRVLADASAAMAKVKGAQTGRFTFYLPPNAEDFMGLM